MMSLLFQAVVKMLITTESTDLLMFMHAPYMRAEYLYLFCASGPAALEGSFSLKFSYCEIVSLAVLKSPEAILALVCAVDMV